MRGEIGDSLTMQGDVLYDLSKVYQSLLGYDFILLSKALQERDAEILEDLRDEFFDFIKENYKEVQIEDVVRLTASHYFGIVPLHVNRDHQRSYLATCKILLASLPAGNLY